MGIYSYSSFGYEGCLVTVDTEEKYGIPSIDIVGLSEGEVNGDVNETSIGVEFSTEHDESVNGLKAAKSALETAALSAAGGFHTLLVGHPGCGKTLLASGLMSAITPNLTREESQTVARIHSLAGLAGNEGIKMDAPFRVPHQTASIEGMFGGGMRCMPGEISLAHNGVLFLDEAAEFRSSVLQMLRVPLESKSITLSRAGRSTVYPADFQLIMTANPCPCGNYGFEEKICHCSETAVEQYWRKFSGPLLDRISVKYNFDEHCDEEKVPVNLEELRDRVRKVIEHSRKNFGKKIQSLSAGELSRHASLSAEAKKVLGTKTAGFSERCRMNVIRVALCSAVMDGRDEIDEADIGKALSFTVDFTLGIHF